MGVLSSLLGVSESTLVRVAMLLVAVVLAGVVVRWVKTAAKLWLLVGLVGLLVGGWTLSGFLDKTLEGVDSVVSYAQDIGRSGDVKVEDGDVKVRIQGLNRWVSLSELTIKYLDGVGAKVEIAGSVYSVTDPLMVKVLNEYKAGNLVVGK